MATGSNRLQNTVGVFVLLICISVMAQPELAEFQRFQLSDRVYQEQTRSQQGVVSVVAIDQIDVENAPYPSSTEEVFLEIPSINVYGRVLFSHSERVLSDGFWNYLGTSPWETSGNTVIVGHRYDKLPPNKQTFFNLHKIKENDPIILRSEKGEIRYEVTEKVVISVEDVTVLKQTLSPRVTLITCHPLWTSRERLVIIAERKEVIHNETTTNQVK